MIPDKWTFITAGLIWGFAIGFRLAWWMANKSIGSWRAAYDKLLEFHCALLLRTSRTYSISDDAKSILCLLCGRRSHNPNDVKNKYCGACHRFHDAPLEVTPEQLGKPN